MSRPPALVSSYSPASSVSGACTHPHSRFRSSVLGAMPVVQLGELHCRTSVNQSRACESARGPRLARHITILRRAPCGCPHGIAAGTHG